MGTIPILSEIIDTIGVAINFIGWIWTNSPTILKTFIFFTMIVAIVGSLAWFFDQSIIINGITVKAPTPHRLFLNNICKEAQNLVAKDILWSDVCHQIALCLNENGGNVSLMGVVIPYTSYSWSLWTAPRCSCSCYELESRGLLLPPYITKIPAEHPSINMSSLICQQTFTDPCYNYTGYTTNTTLNLYTYCLNKSLPTPEEAMYIKNQNLNASMTLEKCKTQGWDFLDWKGLLILEAIVLLTQFALTIRASRSRQ